MNKLSTRSWLRSVCFVPLCLCVSLLVLSPVWAAEPSPVNALPAPKARELLDAMIKSREALQSGGCLVEEFDSKGNKVRQHSIMFQGRMTRVLFEDGVPPRITRHLLFDGIHFYVFEPRSRPSLENVVRMKPDSSFLGNFRPIDVKCLGLTGSGEYQAAFSLEQFFGDWLGKNLVGVDGLVLPQDKSEVCVTLDRAEKQRIRRMRLVYSIDTRTTHLPDRIQWFSLSSEDAGRSWSESHLMQEAAVQWEKSNEVYVPTKLNFTNHSNNRGYELRCQWDSINSELDPKAFTLKGMGIAVGTQIVDFAVEPNLVGAVE